MKYITVNNYSQHQSHKDGRRIIWIKLAVDILDKYNQSGETKRYFQLPDTSKLTYIHMLCLQAQYDRIPYESDSWLKDKLGLNKIDVQPLISAGLITIDDESVEVCNKSVQSCNKLLQEGQGVSYKFVPKIEKEIEIEKEKRGAFAPPSPLEVSDYAKSIGYNLDGQSFVDFYESKGWMVGKNKMVKWQAAVRKWKSTETSTAKPAVIKPNLCLVDSEPAANQIKQGFLCNDCFRLYNKSVFTTYNGKIVHKDRLDKGQIEDMIQKTRANEARK